MQRVIYLQNDGVVAVVVPSPSALSDMGINAIAKLSVPAGNPYKIIDSSEIPTDRSQRNAWTVDVSDLTDGIGEQV